MIEVRLFATLRENRGKILMLDAEKYHCGNDIVKDLDIPAEEVAIFLINGFHSALDSSVKDGDILAIFPPVGGG